MSYYYKYAFVSPEPVYSTVKEELKSYFDTGAVDDLLFPTYLDKSLKKLGRTTYVITDEVLFVEDFEARLPDNFYAVREAWMTTEVANYPYQSASSFYSQAVSESTIQVSPLTIGGTQCNNGGCQDPGCEGNCMPVLIQAVYKTTNSVARGFTHNYLLKPGSISARKNCDVSYTNNFTPGSASIDSFDIRDNKFVTNFRNGVVHLIFYATEYDEIGNQLIPDNYRIREYVEAFLKFKVFETLTNQTVDETFNQLQQKLMYHKQAYEEAFIMAMIEVKKETAWEKQRKIKNDLNRFNMYELPTSRYGRRRNN
jgi:hypothetical protein